MRYVVSVLVLGLCLALGCAESSSDPAERDSSLVAPQAAEAELGDCLDLGLEVGLDCDNSQGSEIHVSGSVTSNGLSVILVSSNSRNKPPHVRDDVLATWELIPAGEIVFDKEPVLGGVGGNPHFWTVVVDGAGNWISEPAYQGRCVQGNR